MHFLKRFLSLFFYSWSSQQCEEAFFFLFLLSSDPTPPTTQVAPVFDPKDKSLTLELMELSDFSAGCRTPFYSVELWRVIQQPGIELPKNFGSTEYFEKDQHCENPNPDLLSR